MSERDVGGPPDEYVGVKDGSQKSGNLCLRASACSRSICRKAASSASLAFVSAVVESKANFRFVPRAVVGRHEIHESKPIDKDSQSSELVPEVVAVEADAASPNWPLSNSSSTLSRAASRALSFSSSASRFNTSKRAFCFLISESCVTDTTL